MLASRYEEKESVRKVLKDAGIDSVGRLISLSEVQFLRVARQIDSTSRNLLDSFRIFALENRDMLNKNQSTEDYDVPSPVPVSVEYDYDTIMDQIMSIVSKFLDSHNFANFVQFISADGSTANGYGVAITLLDSCPVTEDQLRMNYSKELKTQLIHAANGNYLIKDVDIIKRKMMVAVDLSLCECLSFCPAHLSFESEKPQIGKKLYSQFSSTNGVFESCVGTIGGVLTRPYAVGDAEVCANFLVTAAHVTNRTGSVDLGHLSKVGINENTNFFGSLREEYLDIACLALPDTMTPHSLQGCNTFDAIFTNYLSADAKTRHAIEESALRRAGRVTQIKRAASYFELCKKLRNKRLLLIGFL